MKLYIFALALGCASSFSSAMILQKRNYKTCETSNASPQLADCKAAVAGIDDNGCYKSNQLGSGCRNIHEYGTCRISVCRTANGRYGRIRGSNIKNGLRKLLDDCPAHGQVGGYFHYDDAPDCMGEEYHGYMNVEFSTT